MIIECSTRSDIDKRDNEIDIVAEAKVALVGSVAVKVFVTSVEFPATYASVVDSILPRTGVSNLRVSSFSTIAETINCGRRLRRRFREQLLFETKNNAFSHERSNMISESFAKT